jgi:hypothetical protein
MNRHAPLLGLAAITLAFGAHAADKSIVLNEAAGYVDASLVQSNIVKECKELGSELSNSTKSYLEQAGWSVRTSPDIDALQEGTKLKLTIKTAFSSGNAFMGHRKSVSIKAELFKDGKLVDEYAGTRNSSGGVAGGFSGSCDVLFRCANTLGNDVSKWLSKRQASAD